MSNKGFLVGTGERELLTLKARRVLSGDRHKTVILITLNQGDRHDKVKVVKLRARKI